MTIGRVISRREARERGLARYFPGSQCVHGHTSERLVSNGSCLACCAEKAKGQYWANREANLAAQKIQRERHGQARYAKRRAERRAARPALATQDLDMAARAAAAASGESMYGSPRTCRRCDTARRFSSDGKCVECNRVACAKRVASARPADWHKQQEAKALRRALASARKQRAQAVRDSRRTALEAGALTYRGKPCPRGHDGVRYAKVGSCIECCKTQSASPEKKAYDAEYLKANREAILTRTRQYHANLSPEERARRKEQARDWALSNPETRRAIAQNYKHRRRAQEKSGITGAELLRWKRAQEKVCYWCGVDCGSRYHVDHYVALANGGKHEISNLVIACPPCNQSKSAKDPERFREELRAGLFAHLIASNDPSQKAAA